MRDSTGKRYLTSSRLRSRCQLHSTGLGALDGGSGCSWHLSTPASEEKVSTPESGFFRSHPRSNNSAFRRYSRRGKHFHLACVQKWGGNFFLTYHWRNTKAIDTGSVNCCKMGAPGSLTTAKYPDRRIPLRTLSKGDQWGPLSME